MEQREILIQIKVEVRRNTLCISRNSKRRDGSKDPLGRGKAIQEYAKLKRERGEETFTPL